MPPSIIGSLRPEKATAGEKKVLKALRTALPNDFDVYVELPIDEQRHRGGEGGARRYPDFVVLANYGFVVVEVKDWVQIERADRFGAHIRTRGNKVYKKHCPVEQAREYALILADKMKGLPARLGEKGKLKVPYGSAVVLPNLHMSTITQLRKAWGEHVVLGMADLKPHSASKRLRAAIPRNRMLTGWELDKIRGVINPTIVIEQPASGEAAVLLDREQEQIVAEPVRVEEQIELDETGRDQQATFLDAWEEIRSEEEAAAQAVREAVEEPGDDGLLPLGRKIALNNSIRLVRGVAGSGKSLVLVQRAKYLRSMFPEWNMLALTYNDSLARSLDAQLRDVEVPVKTFHSLCWGLIPPRDRTGSNLENPVGWLQHYREQHPVVGQLGPDYVSSEIEWIKETGLVERARYLKAERKGRERGLGRNQREDVFEVFLAYQSYLAENNMYDYGEFPYMVLRAMAEDPDMEGRYDAVLIDEAQDFAPVWMEVIKRILKENGGLLFMADDPSQSIFRYHSWKAKGVPVVGRTRWLRVPYRNTRQIFEAAYELIRSDEALLRQMREETGMDLEPDLAGSQLRDGEKPLLRVFEDNEDMVRVLRSEISHLLQEGIPPEQIAVLHRRASGRKMLKRELQGLNVVVNTFHGLKGMEYRVVFLTGLEESFRGSRGEMTGDELSAERRLLYMAMTRARARLWLCSIGRPPQQLRAVDSKVDMLGI